MPPAARLPAGIPDITDRDKQLGPAGQEERPFRVPGAGRQAVIGPGKCPPVTAFGVLQRQDAPDVLADRMRWRDASEPPGGTVEDYDAARVIGDYQAVRQVVGDDKPATGVAGSLHRASLHRASLRLASLRLASLYRASLYRASLYRASLYRASVYRASVYRASVYRASVHRASVHRASVHRASLYRASLYRASVHRASLHLASVHRASLHGASDRGLSLARHHPVHSHAASARHPPRTMA